MSIIPSTRLAEAICDWTIDIRDICRTYVSNIGCPTQKVKVAKQIHLGVFE